MTVAVWGSFPIPERHFGKLAKKLKKPKKKSHEREKN
jgi:hypothetical protein